eukprot:jgi/Ulvmu1/1773/UM118_0012.1
MRRFLPPAPLREECGCRLEGDDSHVGLCVSLGRKFRDDVPVSEQTSEDHCTWHQFTNSNMYCVLDGHGGTKCSRVAAAMLEESIKELSQAGTIEHEALSSLFQSVDSRWAAQCDDSGTTVTLAIVQDRNVTLAHVGDSVAMLVKSDGSTERLTTPHLASNAHEQELVRARGGTITLPGGPGESHRVEGLIEVTRALGDLWIKDKISCDPDIHSFDLVPEDKLLIMATDGLWDTVNAAQASLVALTELGRGSTPVQVAQALAKRAFVSGSVDDIGVLVVLLDTPAPQLPASTSTATHIPAPSSTPPELPGGTSGGHCTTGADVESDADNKPTNGTVGVHATDMAEGGAESCGPGHRPSGSVGAVPAERKCADRGGHCVRGAGRSTRPAHRRPLAAGAAGPVRWGMAALAGATVAAVGGFCLRQTSC